jgi:hypothetical protein
MRRSLHIAAALTATLLLATAAARSQTRRIDHKPRGQFWGTWVHQVQVGPGLTVPALAIFSAEGAVTGVGGLLFGGLPDNPLHGSPIYGVWEKTGRASLGATTFSYFFDAATGVLLGYERHRASLDFGADFDSYHGVEFIETLSCPLPLTCPDPLDPAAEWIPLPNMPDTGFPVSGTRVEPVAAGLLEP